MRPPVDRERVESFLRALGETYRGPGRVYLVGGTTLVYAGMRAQTLDVDIAYAIEPAQRGAFVRAVRDLKDRLQINVEEVSPGDFIPLPAGYEARARFVGRYGGLDVFHFDPYSVALSKIERGRAEDLDDVLALLANDWLEWASLEDRFREVLPRMASESLRGDPDAFARTFRLVEARWRERGG